MPCGRSDRRVDVRQERRAGQERYAQALHQLTRGVLDAEASHLLRRGADEGDAVRLHRFRKLSVLAQKPVAGKDRLGARAERRIENRFAVEVARGCRGRPDADALVGFEHVQRISVGFGVNGNRTDAQPLQRANDTTGDLAAIGDQNFLEHDIFLLRGSRSARSVQRHASAAPLAYADQTRSRTGVGL